MSDEKPLIYAVVEDAMVAALIASDRDGYIGLRDGLHTLDGKFDLSAVAVAICDALRVHIEQRLEFDEEGVTLMLEGKKGLLE